LADGFERVDWVHVLDGYAIQVNPLLEQGEILATMRYYWVTAQAEYSTDVLRWTNRHCIQSPVAQ
jgi:hypothetical protein